MSDDDDSLRGAYGLQINGAVAKNALSQAYLVEADASWPSWEILWKSTPSAAPSDSVTETFSVDSAVLSTLPTGYVTIDRVSATTTLHLPAMPNPHAVVHPYLASTGVAANHWLGRTPFHAGAFEFEGRAWGVLGGREMGKSSLLMWLHQFGLRILSDDVLVLSDGVAFAGPRCLDLRESAAERFGAGEFLGEVGGRRRWRVRLPAIPSEVPFGGWVFLGWSNITAFETPTPSVRLAALSTHRGLTAPGAGMVGLVDLVTFPMTLFARPRSWDRMDDAMNRLLDAVRFMGEQLSSVVLREST